MLFPTIAFTLFFLVTLTGWSWVPDRAPARAAYLAVASSVFYGLASPLLLGYLLSWCAVLWAGGRARQPQWARLAVGGGLLQLVFWKSMEVMPPGLLPEAVAHWAVPLGVSFFTFQGLTYLFARQRSTLASPWSFARVTAFTAFFPTVLSGPILRAPEWEQQLERNPRQVQSAAFPRAMTSLCLGLFYKLCLSTLLGEVVDAAWSEPAEQNPVSLWLAMYAYAFQLYTDFAGYSSLALAVALLMGFDIPANFNQPYLAQSVQEFWRRWHMSLSSWLRDYLYIGVLQGNQRGRARQVLNVLVTFFLCGAWHGLALHYLVWGSWQALCVAYSTLTRFWRTTPPAASRVQCVLERGVTFHLVAAGWVWFRAPDIETALAFFQGLAGSAWAWQTEHGLTAGLVVVAAACHLFEHRLRELGALVGALPGIALQLSAWALLLIALLMVSPAGLPPFIYFKY